MRDPDTLCGPSTFHPYLKLETVHCFHYSSSSRICFEIIRVFFPLSFVRLQQTLDGKNKDRRYVFCSSVTTTFNMGIPTTASIHQGFFVFQHKSSKVIYWLHQQGF
ncbi:hypothetical protein HanXRQr2_Chr09g0375951 [Helianthus annuus]|uniref:Uncharacterized protein n=1 Tax=Helianthus annuus TaxID=4232 RepID=A0A251TU38_HELAN|nr:hypothetical protein HanXRQr2_Chr09g0375951 [Helianthus annuus]KAJ0478985.1 hypothetical protein HanHA300_Chr13g0505871 [Helianthus annuus]KAJ0499781.1 hypothetical protein HanHA89_Chr13g0537731 [Helianthus annuus]KAJ0525174.1 hypothetical protein HanHA300_Chr09g0308951 [Helianthus annuus]KAJ0665858.1 hypothetical protein HanLR1_Chr13g0508341 [Helianthus annuus]